MIQTFNQHVVKKENKIIVLETIKEYSPISRTNIANKTGLNKGTVSSLVNELLKKDIIYESGPGQSSGGRKPVMLLFKKQAGYSIGIDLGVNYLLGILTDLEGNIINEQKVDLHVLSYKTIEKLLFEVIDALITNAPRSTYGIIGIGIGVPGVVSNDGEILLAPNLNWKQIQMKSILQDKYNLPVIVENEANVGAYGEKIYGVGQDFDDIIYVSVGIGIGVGLILNSKLYKGKNGFSGELGHTTIEVTGERCSCGNTGCWELYASERALLHRAKKLKSNVPDKTATLESLNLLAEDNKNVAHLFESVGDYIGVGINNIIRTLNPELVIIGNRIISARKWIDAPLKHRIQTYPPDFKGNSFDLKYATLGTYSAALGASAFTVENFIDSLSIIK